MKHETISRPRKRKPRRAADQTYGGLPVISTWGEIGKEIGVSDTMAQKICAKALVKVEHECRKLGITFDDLAPAPVDQPLLDDLAITRREWF